MFVTDSDGTTEQVPAEFRVGSEHGLPSSTGAFNPDELLVDSFFDVFFDITFTGESGSETWYNQAPVRFAPDTSNSVDPTNPFAPGTLWEFSGTGEEAVPVFGDDGDGDTGNDQVKTEIEKMELRGANNQNQPIWPVPTGGGEGFDFQNSLGRSWIDPPSVDGYTYTMNGSSLFTRILDFPTGFDQGFEVLVDGTLLGTFGPGDEVDFVSLLGGGVEEFTVQGISPLVEEGDPTAFPLQLQYNTDTASFTMTPIPEPAAWTLAVLAGLVGMSRRRRR